MAAPGVRILGSFMASNHNPDETILDRLRAHAESSPDRLAYRFLHEYAEDDTLTFGQLDQRVRSLATRLREHASPGDRALLLYPPGIAFRSRRGSVSRNHTLFPSQGIALN